jgi:hypothetical protein
LIKTAFAVNFFSENMAVQSPFRLPDVECYEDELNMVLYTIAQLAGSSSGWLCGGDGVFLTYFAVADGTSNLLKFECGIFRYQISAKSGFWLT